MTGSDEDADTLDRKRPRGKNVGRDWDRRASENMAVWGVQHPEELIDDE